MSRLSRRYVQPMLTDGTLLGGEGPPGMYTLSSGTTYLYLIAEEESPFISIQLTGYSTGLIITSAKIQDTNHGLLEVVNNSTVAGEWVDEDPAGGFVAVDGTGWSQSASVVSAAGSGVGGAVWHFSETGSFRARLAVFTGATGGLARVSVCGK